MEKDNLNTLQDGLRKLRDFTLHVRNAYDIGPHPIRAEGVTMTDIAKELIEIVEAETEIANVTR